MNGESGEPGAGSEELRDIKSGCQILGRGGFIRRGCAVLKAAQAGVLVPHQAGKRG